MLTTLYAHSALDLLKGVHSLKRKADHTVRTVSMEPLPPGVLHATRPFVVSASMPWGNSGIQSILCASTARSPLQVAHFMNMEASHIVRYTITNKQAVCALAVARPLQGDV